jgi:hypothetical protein
LKIPYLLALRPTPEPVESIAEHPSAADAPNRDAPVAHLPVLSLGRVCIAIESEQNAKPGENNEDAIDETRSAEAKKSGRPAEIARCDYTRSGGSAPIPAREGGSKAEGTPTPDAVPGTHFE